MGEFELIRQYFLPLAELQGPHPVGVGPGDDCAVQSIPPGFDLAFSIDTLVEGVHFPFGYRPDYLGWRALAVAASDLAAMGAEPSCFTLALTLPEADEAWIRDFAQGLCRAARAFGMALAGGDTTRGPLTLSLQVHGMVRQGQAIRRTGAKPGDLVVVSGPLGDAGAALEYLESPNPSGDEQQVLECYHHPQPRLELGRSLSAFATSAIDVSDGLLADLGHILEASRVGANIEAARIPLSPALVSLKGGAAIDYALGSGDDYQLCATIPKAGWARMPEALRQQLTVIGEIEAATGLRLDGAAIESGAEQTGFDHFRRKA